MSEAYYGRDWLLERKASYGCRWSRQPYGTVSAGDRTGEVGDLLAGVPRVDAAIHPPHPLAHRGVLDLQEVRQVRRPHVEARVGRAEQEPQLALGQVRMPEGRRVAVEVLPLGFGEQRLELLEHRRRGTPRA